MNRKQILEGCLLQSLILAPSLIAKVADDLFQLEFENPDLLAEISKVKTTQLLVGFAAEENANLLQEGKRKLESKNLDIIYANDIADGTIFGSDMTSGFLIDRNGEVDIKATSKKTLASRLLDMVSERLNSANV